MESLLQIALSNAVVAAGLAVVAVAVGRICRRPALTHGLWVLVLLKLVTPPLVFVPVPWLTEEASSDSAPAADSPGIAVLMAFPDEMAAGDIPLEATAHLALPAEPATDPENAEVITAAVPTTGSGPNWLLIAGGCWLIGSAAWFTLAVGRARRFHGLLHFAQPAPHRLQREIACLAERMGLARPPTAWLVPGAVSPMLWSLGTAPKLLLPSELLARLSASQRETVLVHELAHFLRRDHWVRWLELLVTGIFWWYPIVWWARRELREAEELCCDAWVVWTLPEGGRAYATALVECIDFLSGARPLPIGASGVGRIENLKRRLTMILGGTTPRRLTWLGGALLLGVGTLLPVLPTRADEGDKKPPVERKVNPQEEQLREQIEQLRKLLQDKAGEQRDEKRTEQFRHAIELYRKAAEAPPEKKADPKEIEMARAQIEKLKKELESQAASMRQLEAKLREAAAHLAQLEGHKGGDGNARIIILRDGELPPDILKLLPQGNAGGIRWSVVNPNDATPRFVPKPPQGGGGDRIHDLEKKLEGVLKELEELKRQIPRSKPGAGLPALPGVPGLPARIELRSTTETPANEYGFIRRSPAPEAGTRPEDARKIEVLPVRSRTTLPAEGIRIERKPEIRIEGNRIEIELERSKPAPEKKPESPERR